MAVDYEEGRRLLARHAMYRVEASERDLSEWLLDNAEALLNPDPWRGIEELRGERRTSDNPVDLWINGARRTDCWFMEGWWWARGKNGEYERLAPPTHFREIKGPGQ